MRCECQEDHRQFCLRVWPFRKMHDLWYGGGGDEADDKNTEVDSYDENCTSQCDVVEPSLGQMLMQQAGLNRSVHSSISEDRHDLEAALSGTFCHDYSIQETLGQGTFGFVRRAKCLATGGNVVVKFVRTKKVPESGWCHIVGRPEPVPLEVEILSRVVGRSKFIIELQDFHVSKGFVSLVMEDFGSMDLFDFVDRVQSMEEPLARHIFAQILQGVEFLSENSILHRDIKDENVVINRSFACKLIDFGSAAYMLPEGELFDEFRGTKEYCSPEVWAGNRYSGPPQEMWALGVTLFTLLNTVNPFPVEDPPYQLTLDDLPETQPAALNDLLLGLLECEPTQRLTLEGAANNPWVADPIDASGFQWKELIG
ncbi:PAS domain-containing serine/threonine-protein kinase [Aplysia californica]|uniref:PAS domain-containing serine/threonine-protein kinase n=1 Tax=Aplysia californica TaxID=6500 RepID=A0ABM1VTU9_APLCA|nr:PAS domain-containing serine/threonine-protein kinase [Aplysia californica]